MRAKNSPSTTLMAMARRELFHTRCGRFGKVGIDPEELLPRLNRGASLRGLRGKVSR